MRPWIALLLLALSGCATLPRIVPDMALPREPLQVNGAQGPLTGGQAKAVVAGLKASKPHGSLLDRQLAIEQAVVGSPLVVGNRVTLLRDGAETFAAEFDAIRRAKDHVNVETFLIEDDEVGNRFADLLIEKQSQNVQVNLIYDSVGSIATPRTFFKRLTDAGVNVLQFNPVNPLTAKAGWNVNHRDHRKLIIVDGQTAFVGGVNISSVYSEGPSSQLEAIRRQQQAPWRDTQMQIEGPVVADFQKLFLANWQKQKGKALAPRNYFPRIAPKGKEIVRAIGSSPDDADAPMYATLISAIQNAESTVYLTNAYFVPDEQLLRTLKDAARRGVDVRLVLPKHSDWWLTLYVGRSHYEELLEAGVKIYERRSQLLHAKTAVIDGVWSTIGSTNLDWRSFLHNDEINAVVLSADFAAKMKAMFERDIAESDAVTPEAWDERSPAERVRETLARFWQRAL